MLILKYFKSHGLLFISIKCVTPVKIVREQGYSIDDEEFEIGVRAVGVGICNHKGNAIAAISLGGQATRVTHELLPELITSQKRLQLESHLN
ncbi:MAG: IclR family transcriptional regulator domain-containing protein [Desulfitobacteriaceae bacterium]